MSFPLIFWVKANKLMQSVRAVLKGFHKVNRKKSIVMEYFLIKATDLQPKTI